MKKKLPYFFLIFLNILTIAPNLEADAPHCFGAVGKQCATPDKVNGQKLSPLNIVACSKVEKNQTNCWISPGSIEHDNCCVKHPQGVMCSSTTKNDGSCAKEWEDAYKDISKRMAWYHVYNALEGANLSSVQSKRMQKFGGQEAKTTQALCAPGGTKLLSNYDSSFCCAGQAKKQGETMICAQETVAKKSGTDSNSKKSPEVAKSTKSTKKSQDFLNKAQEAFAKLDKMLKGAGVPQKKRPQAPPQSVTQKPTQPHKIASHQTAEQKWPELSPQQRVEATNLEKQIKECVQKAQAPEQKTVAEKPQAASPSPPPPPPPLPILPKPQLQQPNIDSTPALQRADPHPLDLIYKQPPPPSPPEEPQAPTAGQPCNPNMPKYEQSGCIEAEQHEEEAPPPDCGAGAHWSPTLQSCQSD